MRWLWILSLALLGCEEPMDGPSWPGGNGGGNGGGHATDTSGGNGGPGRCPAGMEERTDLSGVVNFFSYNSVVLLPFFTPEETYEGQAGGCASADSLRVRILLSLGGEPFAWVTSDAPREGTYNPMEEQSLSVDLFNAEPPAFIGPNNWTSGTWGAVPLGDGRMEHRIDSGGSDEVETLLMTGTIWVP